ncbi:MAG: hypothetical protein J0H69_06060 [Burkholderiales bacterium]|nr:hypothetical protein [Burkholderiales bacterium]
MKLNLVPARTGIQWVKLGIRTFWRQPLALSGLFFLYITAVALLSMLQFVGAVLALALTPAATFGLMVATQEAVRGQFPMPGVLVSALRAGRERLRAILQLGAMYAAGALLVTLIVRLVVPAPVAAPQPGELPPGLLLTLLLHAPLAIAFWFAPALVHWHGVQPVKSLFFSVVAVMRNFWAFAVYALAWGAVILAAGFLVSMVALAIGNPAWAPVVMMPLALMVAAMFFTSIYFTFVDCFGDPDATAPTEVPAFSDKPDEPTP